MKRPQFSLRLMLLVVALFATIIGWRTAVEQVHRVNRIGERKSLQLDVSQFAKFIDEYKQMLEEPDNGRSHAIAKEAIEYAERHIADTNKRIDELSK